MPSQGGADSSGRSAPFFRADGDDTSHVTAGRVARDAELLEKWRPALEAKAREVAQRSESPRKRDAAEARAKKKKRATARELHEAQLLYRRAKGPALPLHLMRNARTNIVREDLAEVLPGFYQRHRAELDARARRLPAVSKNGRTEQHVRGAGLALLALCVFFRRYKPGGACLQMELGDFARTIGCSRSWLYVQLGRMVELGYLGRRGRRCLYKTAADKAGLFFEHDGERCTFTRWRDQENKLRWHVDRTAVLWATVKGVRRFNQLVKGRRSFLAEVPHGALTELFHSTKARRRALEDRLAQRAAKSRTPYGVEALTNPLLSGRAQTAVGNPARPTGPPGKTGPPLAGMALKDRRNYRRRVAAESPGLARCSKGLLGRGAKPRSEEITRR